MASKGGTKKGTPNSCLKNDTGASNAAATGVTIKDSDELGEPRLSGDRFCVTKSGTHAIDMTDEGPESDDNDDKAPHGVQFSVDTNTTVMFDNKMDLYDDEGKDKSVQTLLYDYTHPGANNEEDQEPKDKANLGTMLGVFMPCLQNIFGVIYFVRLYWIVGEAGSVEAFFIVFSCCGVSILTSLSICAIATNGQVTGGGTYFMISRSLGPEFGGAVGILFFMGISISVAMYLAGSIELLTTYIVPQMNVFEDKYNNARLFGTLLLILVAACVFIGVKFVSKFALVVLSSVLIAILSVYIGMFVANPEGSMKVCFLGDRLLEAKPISENGILQCHKNSSGPMYHLWCNNGTCDPYFEKHKAELRPGVPGFSLRLLKENYVNHYGKIDTLVGEGYGEQGRGEISRDITTSFVILLAIYFPSITGFEQGTSYSGDLKDAQKSIPQGTLYAVLVTSIVYLSTVVMFSACVEGQVLRDKFGTSIHDQLIMSRLSWPTPWVILVGALMSTVGAGLQALMAAPRLLQAIAKDNVFPILQRFSYMTNQGEPVPAIALSFCIAEIGILIANLDYVAPIVTMFFLICYGFVNFACALQSLLRTPHWRPR
ncbi:hypothetical protein V1264_001047 [Littorina saxatilis]|uniref:Amino acid permease/ SLC12A domain-containing protein n=1 Tax=Littorina saxatilis TaxID=31220 RepID=A0AAN9GNJ5_9CAEN